MSVLNRKEIKELCKTQQLIQPYDPKNIKYASYDLRVGSEYRLSYEKEVRKIGKNGVVEIPPYSVCFVLAEEKVKLPKNACAFIFSRHRAAKEGFLMHPQPPFDPGYEGSVCVLLHNLSNETVRLQQGEHLATMVFLRLSSPVEKGYGSNKEDKYMGAESLVDVIGEKTYTSALENIVEETKKTVENWKTSFLAKWLPLALVLITILLMIITILLMIEVG